MSDSGQTCDGGELLELGKSLITAARLGDTNAVMNLMKYGAPFATDWWGMTSLHHAALKGHLDTCELLVRSGILKDARSKVEKTPLHLACQEGHTHIALFLLANGADVNAIDLIYMTPLHWAVETRRLKTIVALLQNGADPNMVNKFDKSAFDIAADNGSMDILNLLKNGVREGTMTVIEKSEPKVMDIVKKRTFPIPLKNMVRRAGPTMLKRRTTSPKVTIAPLARVDLDSGQRNMRYDEEEEMRQLLEEHGIEMLEGEDINLVASAVDSGQTVILTEAGRQALTLTEAPESTSPVKYKFVAPHANKGMKRPAPSGDDVIAAVSEKYMQAKREAQQYRILYAAKKRQVEEYESKLKSFALSSITDENSIDDVEDENPMYGDIDDDDVDDDL